MRPPARAVESPNGRQRASRGSAILRRTDYSRSFRFDPAPLSALGTSPSTHNLRRIVEDRACLRRQKFRAILAQAGRSEDHVSVWRSALNAPRRSRAKTAD